MDNHAGLNTRPPATKRLFGIEAAYNIADRMKVVTGCGICGNDDLIASELEWYDNKLCKLSTVDAVLLTPYREVLTRFTVVCLNCVQAVRNVEIPAIGRT